jgi:hypothetical protein
MDLRLGEVLWPRMRTAIAITIIDEIIIQMRYAMTR